MKKHPKTVQGPFAIGPSGNQTGDVHFASRRNHRILSQNNDPLQAVGLLLWLGVRRHWCRRRKYYICPALLHQPLNFLPELGSHTQLHYKAHYNPTFSSRTNKISYTLELSHPAAATKHSRLERFAFQQSHNSGFKIGSRQQ